MITVLAGGGEASGEVDKDDKVASIGQNLTTQGVVSNRGESFLESRFSGV